MWLMLQQESAQDYVIATGVAHSVREFVLAAFKHVGVEITCVHDPSNSVCPCHAASLHVSLLLATFCVT